MNSGRPQGYLDRRTDDFGNAQMGLTHSMQVPGAELSLVGCREVDLSPEERSSFSYGGHGYSCCHPLGSGGYGFSLASTQQLPR